EDIRDHLVERFPGCNDRALGYTARLLLPLVQEPTDAAWGFPSVARFALADAWLGAPIDDAADPGPLVLRYLAAFGPPTAADAKDCGRSSRSCARGSRSSATRRSASSSTFPMRRAPTKTSMHRCASCPSSTTSFSRIRTGDASSPTSTRRRSTCPASASRRRF